MLEKIGLPAKPSLKGNAWVVDASHCQGCSSQFTFINRKHHCRRCGGLFCSSCTQQRRILRGQGDSPVRICEPCKKLEEAARFELRNGNKNRAGRGGSKLSSNQEEFPLNQILSNEGKDSFSSARASTMGMLSSSLRTTSDASSSSYTGGGSTQDGEILKSLSLDHHNMTDIDTTTTTTNTPEELRQQASEEKNKHKTLKAEGKSGEALKAFKKGKELERQAAALELNLRKNRKKVSLASVKDDSGTSGRRNNIFLSKSEGKDDLASELKELGWSDMDLKDTKKQPAALSLESELSTLLGEDSRKTNTEKNTHSPDKSQVIVHKKKALELKRAGNLAEAKEELKKAKLLEKRIEEQELLGEDEESDDELSLLMRSLDNSKNDDLSVGYDHQHSPFDFDLQLGIGDDLDVSDNLEVEDEDMDDPEIAAALTSLGWTEETTHTEESNIRPASIDREALMNEIHTLKIEALTNKRAGNTLEAMALLKKAKVLEIDLKSSDSQSSTMTQKGLATQLVDVDEIKVMGPKRATKSRSVIQKELLGLKRRAFALKREGKVAEAEAELEKGKVLEKELEEMDNAPKAVQPSISNKPVNTFTATDPGGEDEDVTDQDMQDPAYLSLLNSLGWKDDNDKSHPLISSMEKETSAKTVAANSSTGVSRKSRSVIQKELLGLKRRAFALKREGKVAEAEAELEKGKVLERELEEMDNAPKAIQPSISNKPINTFAATDHGDEDEDVTDQDMHDPTYLSLLNSLGWKDDNDKSLPLISSMEKETSAKTVTANISTGVPRKSKGEIQRELLGLKRKSFALRRQGDVDEAEEVLKMAKVLEAQLAELETPQQKDVLLEPESDINVKARTDSSLKEANIPFPSDSKKRLKEALASNSTQTTDSQNDQSILKEDILAHKRKALMLKKEGNLAEAKEELRQAKLLEKQLEEKAQATDSSLVTNSTPDVVSSKVSSVVERKEENPNLAKKPLTSRERFKIQQQSLSHKRQALKLRKEGRTEEADAESELAKALEAQLEESSSHDLSKSSEVNDVSVEDFLDPQLMSALRALGIPDLSSGSLQVPEPKKSVVDKIDSSIEERTQLEEQIKAEKLKALNLKRSGKQAEALDALRRAKQFEKKLNSLSS